MSEIKGQILGVVMVLAIFGAISGVLLTAFKGAAGNVVTEIGNAGNPDNVGKNDEETETETDNGDGVSQSYGDTIPGSLTF